MPEEEKAAEQPNEESKPEGSESGETQPDESESQEDQAPESEPGEPQAEEPKPEGPTEEAAAAEAAPAPPAGAEGEDAWPPAGELTKDEKTMAMLVWLLAIPTAFVGPLVLYLVKKEESKFVAFHALQSLWFSVVAWVIVMILASVTCGVGAVLVIAPVIVDIVWLIKANNGEWAELPVVGKWARKGL